MDSEQSFEDGWGEASTVSTQPGGGSVASPLRRSGNPAICLGRPRALLLASVPTAHRPPPTVFLPLRGRWTRSKARRTDGGGSCFVDIAGWPVLGFRTLAKPKPCDLSWWPRGYPWRRRASRPPPTAHRPPPIGRRQRASERPEGGWRFFAFRGNPAALCSRHSPETIWTRPGSKP